MPLRVPTFLQLRLDAFARGDAVSTLVARLRPSAAHVPMYVSSFAFKCDEDRFARSLLSAKSHLWLFRANQRAFSGDFVVVDVSSPARVRRRALVLDLKRGARVRIGGGGAGAQMRNAACVVRDVARGTGALDESAAYELVTGDGGALLAWFGVCA
jgi:hypothetical protein